MTPNWIWITCPEGLEIEVTTDYLQDDAGVRMALTPAVAQLYADEYEAMLPTPRIVRRIRETPAAIHLPFRSVRPIAGESITAHRLVRVSNEKIEADRAGREGLFVDHKKDIVVANILRKKRDKVLIYGAWYKNAVKPVQPLCSVHSKRYADYSHGTRLVRKMGRLNGAPVQLAHVLAGLHGSPAAWALSDEGAIDPAHLRYVV